MGWGSIRCLLRWGSSARWSLWNGASRQGWGSTLESLGNGTSAGMVYWLGTHSGTGRQQGSLERSLFRDEHGLLKLMNGGSHSLQVNLFRCCENNEFSNQVCRDVHWRLIQS